MDNCTECYRICDPIPDCLTSLSVVTDQTDTEITVRIVDKFNQVYYKTLTTESSGSFTLDLADETIFPKGLINSYAGQFKLMVINTGEPVPFTVLGKNYECLIFEAKPTSPQETTYRIDVYGNTTGGY